MKGTMFKRTIQYCCDSGMLILTIYNSAQTKSNLYQNFYLNSD